ncbi:hypothetical protein [Agathobaculum sp. Marseille-P7918]|uniref:hypothetical protein n=1 Tax=Agathobaculum sp. Marseille-P7918 TaxID=2479843 RepID=UPI000F63DCCD|nr:hypothetical protein [Agathobaculum sp. Marseille-P7918]
MYNRYLTDAAASAPLHNEKVPPPPQSSPTISALAELSRGLSGRLQNIRLDADTIIALVIVWFLLSDDGGEVDWEQLILIGVLLVLGI